MVDIKTETLMKLRSRFNMPELTAEDLKKGIRNPFYKELNTEVTVAVRKDVYEIYRKCAEEQETSPEKVMRKALTAYAKELEEFD
jgi:hypothetical protein